VDNRAEVEFLCRKQWKVRAQREAGLRTKNGIGAGASAVVAESARVENGLKEVKVAFHKIRLVRFGGCL